MRSDDSTCVLANEISRKDWPALSWATLGNKGLATMKAFTVSILSRVRALIATEGANANQDLKQLLFG